MHKLRLAPDDLHRSLLEAAPRQAGYRPNGTIDDGWRSTLGQALQRCLGEQPSIVPLDAEWGDPEPCPRGTLRSFSMVVELGHHACGWLATPHDRPHPPVMICLQGHSSGAHVSLGREIHSHDAAAISGERDFALQALRHGFAALVLEQRAFGVRGAGIRAGLGCNHPAMVALLLGRTLARERVWDVSRAIDLISTYPELDHTRIACMGNSGGGTISWYAAATDHRISAVMASCSICPYGPSIGAMEHCPDNYLPGALLWFDMPDLAGLIAPRPCVITCGQEDRIFPVGAVQLGFATIQQIYHQIGRPDACRLVIGDGGHRFYSEASWNAFHQVTGW